MLEGLQQKTTELTKDTSSEPNGLPGAVEIQDEVVASKPSKIRIVIVDDHPIVREGLRRLLTLETDMEVIGQADNGRQALDMVEDLRPDILVLDLKLPGLDGLSVLQTLHHGAHKTRIVVLTASEDKNEWVQAMKLGCSGIVVKQTQPELIVKSIRKVYAGEIWLDSHTTAAVMRQFASPADQMAAANGKGARERSPLSAREREIVALVAQGYKNKEMAEKMFISEQTVKNHLHNVFDKLGVSDRLELALYAIHKGLHLAAEKQ
ncbi:MAG: response regulator transcription factor [Bryobacterales bacterium]|nr:response regulator transcription factor [Bryobacterales bacterium]